MHFLKLALGFWIVPGVSVESDITPLTIERGTTLDQGDSLLLKRSKYGFAGGDRSFRRPIHRT